MRFDAINFLLLRNAAEGLPDSDRKKFGLIGGLTQGTQAIVAPFALVKTKKAEQELDQAQAEFSVGLAEAQKQLAQAQLTAEGHQSVLTEIAEGSFTKEQIITKIREHLNLESPLEVG